MEHSKKRNGFGSGIGFILAAAGSAIGLGNLWSFPYKTSANGGAAFVFTYLISVILIGVIVMIAELYIGRRAQANPVSAYKKVGKKLGWLGMFAVIVPLIIECYYSVLGGYTIKFAMNSFNGNSGIIKDFATNIPEVIMYTLIFSLLALIIVMAGIKGGIEKASKYLMPALFFILVALVVYCLCLGEGVSDGLNYYLNPDFAALGFEGVLAAMGQAFFSLSLGMGIIVSYGSYTGKTIKLGQSVIMICIFDTLVAVLAGLAIFPSIYHYQATEGVQIENLNGMLLMFESLPMVFDKLGVFGQIVSFLFFIMVAIAAITSCISILEVITQFVIQKFRICRKRAIAIVSAITFAISIPIGISLGYAVGGTDKMTIFGLNLLDFFDTITNVVLMPVCALGACVAIGWCFAKPKKKLDVFNPMFLYRSLEEDGLRIGWFGKVFAVMVKYVTPLIIIFVEIFGIIDIIFPGGAFSINGLGVVLCAFGLFALTVAIYFIFFQNRETGCNADELEIEALSKIKKEQANGEK